ncbi:MAG: phenylalanine--tRNA ligase subunit beta [Oscillospiraceae bacterium]|nr:phenylalanine--tRNA ligase subunit beta [Oscillospiraceae bacterium]
MILSRKWLDEFTDVSAVPNREFCEKLTLTGSKVETWECSWDKIQNVVVGRVTAMDRHPNSDHLWVCQVDVGAESLQIVTGAQNVKAGDLVPVAKDHSLLPGGKRIEKGELRGVESCGMLCSLGELGLDTHDFPDAIEDGIWIITEDAKPGDDIRYLMNADDTQVEFEITPNRPDCLSVIGLAREAAATFGTELKLHAPVVKGSGGNAAHIVSVTIADPDLCPRYTARVVKNVKIGPSPLWLRQRLRAGGVRPISNIVDITNYVMLEYGQPMHAFDFACVEGGKIIVRRARDGETITTLDGKPHELTSSMLCICDENKPVCVAGVMGGANSEIIGDTATVLFEAANFSGPSVRKTAVRLGTRTDSSGRFEKGLDVMNTRAAVDRACELVEMLGCGEVVDGVVDVFPAPPAPTRVKLRTDKINGLLGTDISRDFMVSCLEKIGFSMDGDDVIVPSWRGDVSHYSDLAEEVARFYGYNNLPVTLQGSGGCVGGYSPVQQAENRLGSVCRACGYSEIITYSFVSPSSLDKIRTPADSPLRDTYKILNPLGEDTSVMRTRILPSMLDILARNHANRNDAVRLYEVGKIYLKPGKPTGSRYAYEPKILSLGAYGVGEDFFALKGTVEEILDEFRITGASFVAKTDDAAYHPGRCAEIYVGGTLLGIMGQIHPLTAKNYGLDREVFAAEISLEALLSCAGPAAVYRPLPRFPAVTRDIALVCRRDVTVAAIEDVIKDAAGGILESVKLFDVYEGPGIPAGSRSTAYSLALRSKDGTLTDTEADACMQRVVEALRVRLGAERR